MPLGASIEPRRRWRSPSRRRGRKASGWMRPAPGSMISRREPRFGPEAAGAALEALDAATGPITVAEKLSAEGFGPRLKPNAADVLARLRRRAAGAEPASGA